MTEINPHTQSVRDRLEKDGYLMWIPTDLDSMDTVMGNGEADATAELFEVRAHPHTLVDAFTEEYFFLSNDAQVPNSLAPESTAEHLYQGFKTNQMEQRLMVLSAHTPEEAREFGSQVDLIRGWKQTRLFVMEAVLAAKFGQRELREQLMATGEVLLRNSNDYCDTFWGVCRCPVHTEKSAAGTGTNWLGTLLMQLRYRIRTYGIQAAMDHAMPTVKSRAEAIISQATTDRSNPRP